MDLAIVAAGWRLYPLRLPWRKLGVVAMAFVAVFAWSTLRWAEHGVAEAVGRVPLWLGFAALPFVIGLLDRSALERLWRRTPLAP